MKKRDECIRSCYTEVTEAPAPEVVAPANVV